MLVIIGNGFDLRCGLETDYIKYFKNRYNKQVFKSFISSFENYYESKSLSAFKDFFQKFVDEIFIEITIWDMVFIKEQVTNKKSGWYYIENIIKDYLVNDKLSLNSIRNKLNLDKNLELFYHLLSAFFQSKSLTFSQLQYYEWLLKQLNILEKDFAKYVKYQLETHVGYLNDANRVFNQLCKLCSSRTKEISVISFNYTKPDLFYEGSIFNKSVSITNLTNVHGTIFDNVIFGIDEKDISDKKYISPSDLKYAFTKTARKFNNFEKESDFQLNKNEEAILFFGHSLNQQDYSYFQSIFDYYSIYSSDIKIIFVYFNFDKTKKIKAEMVDSAIKLLKEYGSTMSNIGNGNNLLHKMLLENRLLIKELTDYNYL